MTFGFLALLNKSGGCGTRNNSLRPQGSYILKVSYITLQAWQSAGSKGQQARGEAFDVMPDFLTTRTVARGINTPYR